MVDDDVAERADGIVEVAAILDSEVLRHRDLDGGDVVPAPDRLEHRVREAQEDDLVGAHLPEVVVDPEELGLVDVGMELVRQRTGGLEVVPERLLDHDARVLRQARIGQPFHDSAEEKRRDLEIEDGQRRTVDRRGNPAVRRVVRKVAGHI